MSSEQAIVYLGIPICLAGIIGGLLNIIIFLGLPIFRKNSCAFYLIIMSLFYIGQLFSGLIPRMMISGFGIDWTKYSLGFCKFRWFYTQLCALTAHSCLCFASFDQYCATSSNVIWRRYSNLKLAHRLCFLCFLLSLLHSIPCFIYYDHIIDFQTRTLTCTIKNVNFQRYYLFFYALVLTSGLPVMTTIIFGFLAYRNTQQLAFQTTLATRRDLDQQLTSMILVQAILNFFTIMPYSVMIVFSVTPSVLQQPIITTELPLAFTVVLFLYYLHTSIPCYIYICVSKNFREQIKHIVCSINLNHWRQRRRQRRNFVNTVIPHA